MALTAYDPTNATQTNFLSALALGETGTTSWSAIEGVGGQNLSSYSTDQYGFPQWSGFGDSHAAGTYQFQPSTWTSLAQKYGLNFQNSSDQSEGAWYLAQQTYANKTGGDLTTALQNGDYSSVQSALAGVWPSVTGNSATGNATLAQNLASGTGAPIDFTGQGAASTQNVPGAMNGASSGSGLSSWLIRGGLVIVGGLILIVALWQLLSQNSAIPSPGKVAKSAAKFAVA